jgi:hypothetical protein
VKAKRARIGRPRGPATITIRVGKRDAARAISLLGIPRKTPWPVAFKKLVERAEAGS